MTQPLHRSHLCAFECRRVYIHGGLHRGCMTLAAGLCMWPAVKVLHWHCRCQTPVQSSLFAFRPPPRACLQEGFHLPLKLLDLVPSTRVVPYARIHRQRQMSERTMSRSTKIPLLLPSRYPHCFFPFEKPACIHTAARRIICHCSALKCGILLVLLRAGHCSRSLVLCHLPPPALEAR